eukprot:10934751-Alexandrium_andersonii.AAC.1
MSASLVGSEMCIRDRPSDSARKMVPNPTSEALQGGRVEAAPGSAQLKLRTPCLLYTSDAADDM